MSDQQDEEEVVGPMAFVPDWDEDALDADEPLRILSIDGGGIYGLSGALLLRRLCEKNEEFLSEGKQVHLLSGCSSGAVNALLLAKYKNPRSAVLNGELERFWTEFGTFSNSNPWSALTGMMGLTSLFSAEDFLLQLHRYFEDRTLKDLEQAVFISTFNFTGASNEDRKHGFLKQVQAERSPWMFNAWKPDRPPPAQQPTRAGQRQAHWQPKFFDNVLKDDDDADYLVEDVAYAAATPPAFRAILGGLGDGAQFNSNPTVPAMAFMLEVMENFRIRLTGKGARTKTDLTWMPQLEKFCEEQIESMKAGGRGKVDAHALIGDTLRRIVVLSVGSGQRLPAYAWESSDFGFKSFGQVPTNPWMGANDPVSSFALDAASEEAEFIAKSLLTSRRSIRLNPPLNPMPTVLAAFYMQYPSMRKTIVDNIYQAADSGEAQRAVAATAEFLEDVYHSKIE